MAELSVYESALDPSPEEAELIELYEKMSAFVSAHGPELLTRGMSPIEGNRAIMACLERLANRLAIAERIIDALPSYVCGNAVLAEEDMRDHWKEWTDASK